MLTARTDYSTTSSDNVTRFVKSGSLSCTLRTKLIKPIGWRVAVTHVEYFGWNRYKSLESSAILSTKVSFGNTAPGINLLHFDYSSGILHPEAIILNPSWSSCHSISNDFEADINIDVLSFVDDEKIIIRKVIYFLKFVEC
jgi:hypothetical protein